jgi:hypothetical protein
MLKSSSLNRYACGSKHLSQSAGYQDMWIACRNLCDGSGMCVYTHVHAAFSRGWIQKNTCAHSTYMKNIRTNMHKEHVCMDQSYMNACMHICVYTYIYMPTHKHTGQYIHTHQYICSLQRVHTHKIHVLIPEYATHANGAFKLGIYIRTRGMPTIYAAKGAWTFCSKRSTWRLRKILACKNPFDHVYSSFHSLPVYDGTQRFSQVAL